MLLQTPSLQQSEVMPASVAVKCCAHIYMHMYICICSTGTISGGTAFSLELCPAEQRAVGCFTVACWLSQPHCPGIPSSMAQCWQQGELEEAGASALPTFTQALIHAVFCAFLLLAQIYLPDAQQKQCKEITGLFSQEKIFSTHLQLSFFLYKRYLWGFSATFISAGDTEELQWFSKPQTSHNSEVQKKISSTVFQAVLQLLVLYYTRRLFVYICIQNAWCWLLCEIKIPQLRYWSCS